MSSTIEARANVADFQASDVIVTKTWSAFQALIGFLVFMGVVAVAGVAMGAPIVTLIAGAITAIAMPFIIFSGLGEDL